MDQTSAPITDQQISVLVDVAQSPETQFSGDKKRDIDTLVNEGYVEADNDPSHITKYRLTSKAERLLTSRAAGLNEA
jgi:hypothetical protein